MLSATADAAGTVHLMGGATAGIYYELQEHEVAAYRSWVGWPGWSLDIRELSDNKPESLIRSPSTITVHRLATPSKAYVDELLNWDALIKVAPARPTGTLVVTLEYGGRGTPTPLRDPWD
ncbi:MAG TPA: hypothetical protein VN924_04115 [Bryobacteraceae bacterium]|nr:hypothetical protein [Bryobacteraceae bacterium]